MQKSFWSKNDKKQSVLLFSAHFECECAFALLWGKLLEVIFDSNPYDCKMHLDFYDTSCKQ